MPPRYVYWTIIVDGQPTAFRSGSLEDIMPTFNRLKEKQPAAELKWFQNGQLWPSRHDAQDFMRARGERGRAKDPRQAGVRDPGSGTRDPRTNDKPAWVPRDKSTSRPDPGSRTPDPGEKPEWKPKGTFKPRETGHRPSARDQARSSFKPKSYTPKGDDDRGGGKLDWKPKAAAARGDGPNAGFAKSDPDAPKRKWVPKAEYKKSLGIEVKKDSKWRPGGDHADPKQKYKDAKKAKWTRVKATIRARSTKPRKREDAK